MQMQSQTSVFSWFSQQFLGGTKIQLASNENKHGTFDQAVQWREITANCQQNAATLAKRVSSLSCCGTCCCLTDGKEQSSPTCKKKMQWVGALLQVMVRRCNMNQKVKFEGKLWIVEWDFWTELCWIRGWTCFITRHCIFLDFFFLVIRSDALLHHTVVLKTFISRLDFYFLLIRHTVHPFYKCVILKVVKW